MTQERGLLIDRLGQWMLIFSLGILPVFFLPVTQDYYDTNKWVLLMGVTILLLLLWGLRVLTTGTLTLSWNATTKRFGFLAAAALASLLVSSNKVEALLTPFGLGTFLSLFFMALIGSTFLDEKARNILRWVILSVTSLAGLLAVYQFLGLGKLMFPGVAFLADPLWTPVGTSVGLMTILVVTLPLLLGEALHRKRAGHEIHMTVALVMGAACLGGLVLTTYQALLKGGATTLPFWANWQIMLESYKNWRQLVFGVGAENFLAAFTSGRPASLNMTALWNTRFTVGSSMFFHIATTYGLIGAGAFGWFIVGILRAFVIPAKAGIHTRLSFLLAALSLVFAPPSLPAFVTITTLLILAEPAHVPTRFNPALPAGRLLRLRYPTAVFVLLLVAAASYGLVRAYRAELSFGRSIRALDERNGTDAYNLQIQAITRNPQVSRFHTAYSQTNLALANALASTSTASATPEQLDRDRQTTTQLIQQAIREAKLAVGLAPKNILAWENMAAVYQTLTGVAQGADQWTVAAYARAMQLDSTNPVIRLRLGGAYVGQQKFDRALESYLAAVSLKPDYANAYYNLTFAYREQKKYVLAARALKETLKYVTAGNDDARRVQKELGELRELLTDQEKRALDEPTTIPTNKPQTTPIPAPKTSTEPLSPLPE